MQKEERFKPFREVKNKNGEAGNSYKNLEKIQKNKEEITKLKEKVRNEEKKKEHGVFYPTKVIEYAFSFILLGVVLASLFTFPIGSLTSTSSNTEITFSVGYPWHFFQLSTGDPEKNPILWGGLIGDLILYLFIAYLINIIFNLVEKNVKKVNKKDDKERIQEDKIKVLEKKYRELKKKDLDEKKILEKLSKEGWKKEEIEIVQKKVSFIEKKVEKKKGVGKDYTAGISAYRKLLIFGQKEAEIDNKFLEKNWKKEDLSKIKENKEIKALIEKEKSKDVEKKIEKPKRRFLKGKI